MVQRREVVLVCDFCGTEGKMVETHRLAVDGTARDAEACDTCWSSTLASFAQWATAGRAPSVRKAKVADIVAWPGTEWRFTNHAMQRMGERRVKPLDVLKVIAAPEIKRPGEEADVEIWQRGDTKIYVIPDRQIIKTVAKVQSETSYPKAV